MNRLLDFALRAPKTTLVLLALATAALAYSARSIRVDGSLDGLLSERDPERAYLAAVEQLFGAEDVTIVGVFADDVFRPSTLAKIDRLSHQIADLDGVRQVVSLTTVQNVESDDEGLHVGRLIRELPETAEAAGTLRQKALGNRLYLRNVVAPDGTAAGLTVVYEPMTEEKFEASGLEGRVREIVAAMDGPEHFAVASVPTVKVGGDALRRDLVRLTPLALLALALGLLATLRSLRRTAVALAVTLVGIVWTLGLMGLAGGSITLATLPLPFLVAMVALVSAVLVLSRSDEESADAATPREAVASAMRRMGVPLAVGGLVTAIGLGPLLVDPVQAVGGFGTYAIAGVLSVLVACFTAAPACLALWPAAASRTGGSGRLGELAEWVLVNRRVVFLAALLAVVISGLGLLHLDVRVDDLAFSGAGSQTRRDTALIEKHLAGTQPIYLVIDTDAPGAVTKLKALEAIKDLQAFVAQQPGVDTTMSLLDYLGLLRQALSGGESASMPQTQEEVDQLFLFANPDDMKPLVNGERTRANMLLRTSLSTSGEVSEFVRKVEEFANGRFPRGMTMHPTGSVVLLNRAGDEAVQAQIAGVIEVVAVLFVALSALYLSLRIGLLALVPVAAPTLTLFGIMGWAGVALDLSTTPVATVAIAFAAIATIHFFAEFNERARRSGDQESALRRTTGSRGRSMIAAAVALAAGSLALGSSEVPPLREVGVLAALAVGIVLAFDLLLLPAVVASVRIITLWDLLALKLGPEPHRQIPLFAGLRPFQAKIVVLMARQATAVKGEFITRRGETREELYLLLSGRADVYQDEDGRVIQSMTRGEVIGEMGLVRSRPRAADVVIREEAEYLTLDGRFLRRIERRYPRIAAVVLLNLARILSDRLESTTEALGEPPKR